MQRPYTHPLVLSIAAPGGRLLPARSHGVETLEESLDGAAGATLWTPFVFVEAVPTGPRLSSGPQRGCPTRGAIGTAYVTPPNLWNLAGVASGWSQAMQPTPGRPPTTKLAIGRGWRSFGAQGAGAPPIPGLPEPARMVEPRIPGGPA